MREACPRGLAQLFFDARVNTARGKSVAVRFADAEELYERALGIFKFVVNRNDNWKKEGA